MLDVDTTTLGRFNAYCEDLEADITSECVPYTAALLCIAAAILEAAREGDDAAT